MDFIFIRNAECQQHLGPQLQIDSPVTDAGMKQICITAGWLNYNLQLKKFQGFVSPYWASLQTASGISAVTNVSFTVRTELKDFRKENLSIPNRSLIFQNLNWSKEWENIENLDCQAETGEQLVNRCQSFLNSVKDLDNVGLIVISDSIPCIVLSELASGGDPEILAKRCDRLMSTPADPIKPGLDHGKLVDLLDKQVFASSMKNCGMTLINEGKPVWLSKVVY